MLRSFTENLRTSIPFSANTFSNDIQYDRKTGITTFIYKIDIFNSSDHQITESTCQNILARFSDIATDHIMTEKPFGYLRNVVLMTHQNNHTSLPENAHLADYVLFKIELSARNKKQECSTKMSREVAGNQIRKKTPNDDPPEEPKSSPTLSIPQSTLPQAN